MTFFITLCSYVSMFSFALMILFIVLFRYYRLRGQDNRGIGLLSVICGALFILGVVLIGIFYRP